MCGQEKCTKREQNTQQKQAPFSLRPTFTSQGRPTITHHNLTTTLKTYARKHVPYCTVLSSIMNQPATQTNQIDQPIKPINQTDHQIDPLNPINQIKSINQPTNDPNQYHNASPDHLGDEEICLVIDTRRDHRLFGLMAPRNKDHGTRQTRLQRRQKRAQSYDRAASSRNARHGKFRSSARRGGRGGYYLYLLSDILKKKIRW